ncbi:MAG: MurT ligase domain-containing protein, partial [Cyanobacteria bacterium J06607_15]
RVYDMALRLAYSSESAVANDFKLVVKESLPEAINTALEFTNPAETLHIIPTYSAMLEVREVLVGRKIL